MTVVWVTHSLAQAACLSAKLHVISEGRLTESGPTPEVLPRARELLEGRLLG